jgi:AraC-like DNA-binding protein
MYTHTTIAAARQNLIFMYHDFSARKLETSEPTRKYELDGASHRAIGIGATISVMQLLPDGGYTISDNIKIDGDGESCFVIGRGWLLEVLDLSGGEYFFYSDGELVRPAGSHFGVLYPPFTIVRPHVSNVRGSVVGVGDVVMYDQLPAYPLLLETDHAGAFTSIEQAFQVLAGARSKRRIDVNTRPSDLTRRAKELINGNYLAQPSISKIAARLGVSHEHLTRQFKRDLTITPSKYLHQLRTAEATFRLSLGEKIIDISLDVGYNDLSRFYKQFKNATRTSPGECREILKS